jgi:hypothetical protein
MALELMWIKTRAKQGPFSDQCFCVCCQVKHQAFSLLYQENPITIGSVMIFRRNYFTFPEKSQTYKLLNKIILTSRTANIVRNRDKDEWKLS